MLLSINRLKCFQAQISLRFEELQIFHCVVQRFFLLLTDPDQPIHYNKKVLKFCTERVPKKGAKKVWAYGGLGKGSGEGAAGIRRESAFVVWVLAETESRCLHSSGGLKGGSLWQWPLNLLLPHLLKLKGGVFIHPAIVFKEKPCDIGRIIDPFTGHEVDFPARPGTPGHVWQRPSLLISEILGHVVSDQSSPVLRGLWPGSSPTGNPKVTEAP